MEENRATFASNLIRLRLNAGLTQAELGEKLNYSDKAVSKWERGDAVPDVFVIKHIADLYGVTVDDLLRSHTEKHPRYHADREPTAYSTSVITGISILGIWTMALLIFVVLWLFDIIFWQIFVFALPASLITLLVLHSVWRGGKNNVLIVSALVLSLFVAIYLILLRFNPWQIFLVAIPAELVVFFSFRIKKP